jgi:hypothetical protein
MEHTDSDSVNPDAQGDKTQEGSSLAYHVSAAVANAQAAARHSLVCLSPQNAASSQYSPLGSRTHSTATSHPTECLDPSISNLTRESGQQSIHMHDPVLAWSPSQSPASPLHGSTSPRPNHTVDADPGSDVPTSLALSSTAAFPSDSLSRQLGPTYESGHPSRAAGGSLCSTNAFNPIVTPSTSETASVHGVASLPAKHVADGHFPGGLPTDEIAKAPPEYLVPGGGEYDASYSHSNQLTSSAKLPATATFMSYLYGEGAIEGSISNMSALNPMVTPTTSETESAPCAHATTTAYTPFGGLPTADEVAKAPQDYLQPAKPSSKASELNHSTTNPPYNTSSGRDAVEATVAVEVCVGEGKGRYSVLTESVVSSSAAEKLGLDSVMLLDMEDTTAYPLPGEAKKPLDKATAGRKYQKGKAGDTCEEGSGVGVLGVIEPASLQMYERRLEEAQGRTSELTEYLTNLQKRVDEVRWRHTSACHASALTVP